MKRLAPVSTAGLVLAVTALWGPSPASGIIINGSSARMAGGGWVAVGDVENAPSPETGQAHITAGLSCPGAEVGFNPQPDPPGRGARLMVRWGANEFHLTNLDASRCSLGGPDTFEGSGIGECNGEGAVVTARLTDSGGRAGIGNPDIRPDSVHLDIRSATGACGLLLAGPLAGGNLQMVGDRVAG